MKNFYIAVQVEVEGKCYAHIVVATHGDNLLSKLNKVEGLKAANLCETKKQAADMVECWNSIFRDNGTYMFANSPF